MDWSSSKGPSSWDWPDLEHQQSFAANNIIDGSAGSFSVDLKLGSVITSQTHQLGVISSQALPLPTKRARAAANTSGGTGTGAASAATAAQQQAAYCLVDDCRSDLSNCRDYHKRHKVCEVHSKTPEVTIQGRKQRFCQQCSRFHAPEEFDEGKRSCRKRLDGHNRRRRKPQPETHLQQGTYLSNYPGAGMLSFSNPSSHNHGMSTAISPASSYWSGAVNRIIEHNNSSSSSSPYNKQQQQQQPRLNLLDKQIPFSDYASNRYREAKRLTLFQAEHHHHTHQQHPDSSEHKVFYDGLISGAQTPARPDSSDCALSLLSRPMMSPMHATEIHFRNTIPVQSLLPRQPTSNFSSTLQPTVPAAGSDDVNFHSMFQTGGPEQGSSGNDQPQTLPFYWD